MMVMMLMMLVVTTIMLMSISMVGGCPISDGMNSASGDKADEESLNLMRSRVGKLL